MDSEKRTETLHELDLKYQNIGHRADLLVKDEEARRLRVRNVLTRDENDSLKDQLSLSDEKIKDLVNQGNMARNRLDSATQKSSQQERRLRSQTREIANMKEELNSLNGMNQDSTKTLSEKLALSRELALLRPELDHLRSQLSQQNEILAEKLSLERQVNTLEVALANERRSAQKNAQKQDQDSEIEDELRKQIREAEKQLTKEVRAAERAREEHSAQTAALEEELRLAKDRLAEAEKNIASEKRSAKRAGKSQGDKDLETEAALEDLRQRLQDADKALASEKGAKERLQREGERALAKSEAQRQSLEERLETMASQLRETQAELKKCRADLQNAQAQMVTIPAATTTTIPTKKAAAKGPIRKKRRVNEISSDEKAFQTPGKDDDRPQRPLKKRGHEQTVVGEKSMFSITPFLNKTVNLADLSPGSAGNNATKTLPVFQFRGAEDSTVTGTMVVDGEPTVLDSQEAPKAPAFKTAAKLQDKKSRGRPRKALGEALASKKNLTIRNGRMAPRTELALEKVVEEEDEPSHDQENQENRSMESTASSKQSFEFQSKSSEARSSGVTSIISTEPEPKKKKRKLLGSSNKPSLFDEDDGERETAKRPAKVLGASRGMGKMPTGKVKGAFSGGSFSPLKRDRRGVHASFLA
ncbi:hypothetical protein GQ53DRAFT_826768 [Thozetella sp. PMI_491]|nr:hypothetical protein GQ53DRAFT_826768 [Thozetella sp. PMI_491]